MHCVQKEAVFHIGFRFRQTVSGQDEPDAEHEQQSSHDRDERLRTTPGQ